MPGFAEPATPQHSDSDVDAVVQLAVSAMAQGWVLLQDHGITVSGAPPVRTRYALLHPEVGIALLDVAPCRSLDAVTRMRRALDASGFTARFGAYPPIVYRVLPPAHLYRLEEILEVAFGVEPAIDIIDRRWITRVCCLFSRAPSRDAPDPPALPATERPIAVADALVANAPVSPVRIARGRRALRWFWTAVLLILGVGAAVLAFLGPPMTAAVGEAEPASLIQTTPALAMPAAAIVDIPGDREAWPASAASDTATAEAAAPSVRPASLLRRSDAVLAARDISAARLLYEHAATAGSGAAVIAAGKVYDPAVLAEIGAQGIRPDPGHVAAWYRRAAALGEAEAEHLLRRLGASYAD